MGQERRRATMSGSHCPWLSGPNTIGPDTLRCWDNTICDGKVNGWDCCTCHGGRVQCPSRLPVLCEAQHCAGMTGNCCARVPTECDIGPRVCRTENWVASPPGYCSVPLLPPQPPQSPPSPPIPPAPPTRPPSPPFSYGIGLDVVYFLSCALNVAGSVFLIGAILLNRTTRQSSALRLLVPLALSTAGFAIVLLANHPVRPSCDVAFAALTYFKWAQGLWTIPFAAAVCRSILRSVLVGDTTSAILPLRLELAWLCYVGPFHLLCSARATALAEPLSRSTTPWLCARTVPGWVVGERNVCDLVRVPGRACGSHLAMQRFCIRDSSLVPASRELARFRSFTDACASRIGPLPTIHRRLHRHADARAHLRRHRPLEHWFRLRLDQQRYMALRRRHEHARFRQCGHLWAHPSSHCRPLVQAVPRLLLYTCTRPG